MVKLIGIIVILSGCATTKNPYPELFVHEQIHADPIRGPEIDCRIEFEEDSFKGPPVDSFDWGYGVYGED